MILPKEFKELKHYVESEYFVEQMGEILCLRENCEGCEYSNDCEWVEAQAITNLKMPIRLCIGVDNEATFNDDTQYKYGLDYKEINSKDFHISNLRYYHKDGNTDGYLPESNYTIIKEIPEPDELSPYQIYNEFDDKYYCIRQVCSECPDFKTCKPTITKVKRQYITTALDLQSQEPRCNTIVTKEPNWIKIFRNDSLRKQDKLLGLVDHLFKNHPDLQVDIERDSTYWSWLDYRFYQDLTDLYKLYVRFNEFKQDPNNETKRNNLEKLLNEIVDDYLLYKSKRRSKNA